MSVTWCNYSTASTNVNTQSLAAFCNYIAIEPDRNFQVTLRNRSVYTNGDFCVAPCREMRRDTIEIFLLLDLRFLCATHRKDQFKSGCAA
jgi:hypothetical protein